jgi:Fur family ferric uptake transcriptional regulator
MKKTYSILKDFLKNKGLKHTPQRINILETFLEAKRHLTADELYFIVRNKYPQIGRTTVYRTLKLLCDAGIAQEVYFGERIARYEVKIGYDHHDHMVCVKCGKFFEVFDERIEQLQDELTKKYDFVPLDHRLEIMGLCSKCRNTGKIDK